MEVTQHSAKRSLWMIVKPIPRKSMKFLLLFLGVAVIFVVFEWVLPHLILANLNPRSSRVQESYVLRKVIRSTCHTILRHRMGNHHDAFVALEEVGNKDSIPYLIRALKWQAEKHQEALAARRLVPCTYAHCVHRLEKLTGMKLGWEYEPWENWWKQTGQYLPFDEEKGQLVLPKKKNETLWQEG